MDGMPAFPIYVTQWSAEYEKLSLIHIYSNKISVKFIDDEVVEAQIKGTSPSMDLAVIAVKLSDVKDSTKDSIAIATMGDSDTLKVGEPVIAIGNAPVSYTQLHSLTPPIPGNFRFWCILSIKENLSCAFKRIIVQYNLYTEKQVKP